MQLSLFLNLSFVVFICLVPDRHWCQTFNCCDFRSHFNVCRALPPHSAPSFFRVLWAGGGFCSSAREKVCSVVHLNGVATVSPSLGASGYSPRGWNFCVTWPLFIQGLFSLTPRTQSSLILWTFLCSYFEPKGKWSLCQIWASTIAGASLPGSVLPCISPALLFRAASPTSITVAPRRVRVASGPLGQIPFPPTRQLIMSLPPWAPGPLCSSRAGHPAIQEILNYTYTETPQSKHSSFQLENENLLLGRKDAREPLPWSSCGLSTCVWVDRVSKVQSSRSLMVSWTHLEQSKEWAPLHKSLSREGAENYMYYFFVLLLCSISFILFDSSEN